jgi:hypothetical protein
MTRALALIALFLIITTTLLYQLADQAWALWVSGAAILGFIALRWRRIPASPKILVALAGSSTLALFWVDAPLAVLAMAVDRAAYFATFLIALGFLRIAAQPSPMIRRCGQWVVRQPPGRRYGMLSYATTLFGVILNFGVLHLLGLMVSRGNTLAAARGDRRIQHTRQRRMVLAMLRGFASLPLMSPLTVTLIVLLTMIPGLRWQAILPIGLVTAVVIISLGWLLDTWQYRHLKAPPEQGPEQPSAWRPLVQLVSLIAALTGSAFALEANTDMSLPMAVMVLSPLFGLGWLGWQGKRAGLLGALRLLARRLRRILPDQVAPLTGEVSLLAAAGFLGVVITALITEEQVLWLVALLHLQGVPLLMATIALTVLLGQLGFNPIVSVTLLAAALQPVAAFGLSQELLALGLMCAWSLTVNSSPFTISLNIMGHLAQVSPRHLAYRWNGPFLLISYGFMGVWLMLLEGIF